MPLDPLLVTDGIYEHTMRSRDQFHGYAYINRMYYRILNVPPVPTTTMSIACLQLTARWLANIMPRLMQSYQLWEQDLKKVDGVIQAAGHWRPTYAYGVTTQGADIAGVAAASLPQYCTVSVKFRTGFLGRYWRGGMRLGPIPETDQSAGNAGRLDAAAWGAWQVAVNTWKQDTVMPDGTHARLVVFSPTAMGIGGPGPAVDFSADVAAAPVNEWFRTQRSREAPHVP